MLKVYIFTIYIKNYNKTLPIKARIKIKTELTEIEVKNRTNLKGNFAKIFKRKQDYR